MMRDEQFEDWSLRKDAFYERSYEALKGSGHTQARMRVYIDPNPLIRELSGDASGNILDKYEAAITDALASKEISVTASVEPWGGPKTGGPVPEAQYAVDILNIAWDWTGKISNLAGLIIIGKGVLMALERVTRRKARIDDGFAIIYAADAIFEATGEVDLTLAFCAPLNRHLLSLDQPSTPSSGYLVGFRSATALRMATVDDDGTVRLVNGAAPVELPEPPSSALASPG